jgi:hypothetical protein
MTEGEMLHTIQRLKFDLAQAERRAGIYRAGLVVIKQAETLKDARQVARETIKEAEG